MTKIKPFMDEQFLLRTETAQMLFHEHAKKLPIIDYHCHLVPLQFRLELALPWNL